MQSAVLQILHCIFYCIDVPSSSLQVINADLLRVVTRYIEVHSRSNEICLSVCLYVYVFMSV